MTGFGSPCGACKFLRRKCVGGCVFAPYFCHEQGATQFAAIHRVFGASNASKLLAQLPTSDRADAAASIGYEAQARIQDPVYGCVAHIFVLQQQVISLQAQLASLKAQAAQRQPNYHSTCQYTGTQDTKFYNHGDQRIAPLSFQHLNLNTNDCINYKSTYDQTSPDSNNSGIVEEDSSASMDMETSAWAAGYNDSEDLQSLAYAYMNRS
ncbi:LOB domain-containing protein CRL1-like [Carex rostrata]